jgi:hypothetical protein
VEDSQKKWSKTQIKKILYFQQIPCNNYGEPFSSTTLLALTQKNKFVVLLLYFTSNIMLDNFVAPFNKFKSGTEAITFLWNSIKELKWRKSHEQSNELARTHWKRYLHTEFDGKMMYYTVNNEVLQFKFDTLIGTM